MQFGMLVGMDLHGNERESTVLLQDLELASTLGEPINLARVKGRSVLFIYPRTSPPDGAPQGWDMIPGAKGCTAESCSFRDLYRDFARLHTRIFGASTQDAPYQQEAAERLHLTYPLLSDPSLQLRDRLGLETFEFSGLKL